MNLNKVFILGRTTADPQLRTTPQGQSVATFSIATNRYWSDPKGGKQEQTEFHNIVVWGKQAEFASQFLAKGSIVLVEGRLQTRAWEGKDGSQRKTTEVIAERLQLGPKSGGGNYPSGDSERMESSAPSAPRGAASKPAPKEIDMPVIDIDEDGINPEDLPF
jgi:single-strand DNA-binding protein